MRKLVTIAVAAIALVACGSEQLPSPSTANTVVAPVPQPKITPIVDILAVAGKQEAQVAGVLGEPTSCEDTKQGRKCFYQSGDTEIVFISGIADWITINSLDDAPYAEEALPLLGLGEAPPSFSNDYVMRWNGLPGLLEVSVFPAQGHVDYAYIKTKTP